MVVVPVRWGCYHERLRSSRAQPTLSRTRSQDMRSVVCGSGGDGQVGCCDGEKTDCCQPGCVYVYIYKHRVDKFFFTAAQELCESRGSRPGLSVLTSLLVSVDVKLF